MLVHPERLTGVHPDLVRLVTDLAAGGVDVEVVQGARTVAEERADMAAGRSQLRNPLDSKHVTDPTHRPLAEAVDLAPVPVEWGNLEAFQALAAEVKALADTLGLALAWGGDWHTFKDFDHFELVAAHG